MKRLAVIVAAIAMLALFTEASNAWFMNFAWEMNQVRPAISEAAPSANSESLLLLHSGSDFDVLEQTQFDDLGYFDYASSGSKGSFSFSLAPSSNGTSSTHPGGYGDIRSTGNVYGEPSGDSTDETPEPTTLILLSIGLAGASVARRAIRS